MKVIQSQPGAGDHHGCPYRTFSEDNLRAALGRMRLSGAKINTVRTAPVECALK